MTLRNQFRALRSILLVVCLLVPAFAAAERIAIIGTGDVAGALGPEFAALGHDVVYGSRDPDRSSVRDLVERTGATASATTPAESVADADIVVLAVPGQLAEQITRDLGNLAGKIIIDPTNYVTRDSDGMPALGAAPSNAERIQAAAPNARVVKAFNTLNWRTMVEPGSAGGPVSIPLVGDSAAAKATVAALVEGMGLEPIDLGPLRYANVVEGMLIVWINARSAGQSFNYYLRREPRP